jgi:glycosyltransferase involved in cell wall biosynthesis
MRIVALLGVRNEELYMERCLDHLFRQGIETCVVDNGSTDRTRQIAESFIGRGVVHIDDFPYPGFFDFVGLLRRKDQLASEIDADWFINHDGDEVCEAPSPFRTLREGIEAVDAAGWSAIDFEEFVFVPTSFEDQFENCDYIAEMRHYYYFTPSDLRRVNAWKKTSEPINIIDSGGHRVEFNGRRICPDKFILRHYIILSGAHARRKYCVDRVYSPKEVSERGWHGLRADFAPDRFGFPPKGQLKCLPAGSNLLDRSEPRTNHLIFGQ